MIVKVSPQVPYIANCIDLIELEIQMEDDWKMSNDGYVSVLLALDDVSYSKMICFTYH